MMVNTRAKFKKTQHTLKTCFSLQASILLDSDNDHHLTRESGSLIGSNDGLLTEILGRLPAKSILRFKSVSKHWLSLLSHPRFTLKYDKKRAISPGLFANGGLYVPFDVETQTIPPFRRLDFYPDPRGIKILQSCDGLLLCCSAKGTERSRKYYVFNPTTKQYAIIPSVPGGQHIRKTICFMGLGYERNCAHFKVICIRRNGGLFQSQTYSSDSGKWKILNEEFYARLPFYTPNFRCGVYWNGGIHWEPTSLKRTYFKLDKEQPQTLPLPERRHGSVLLYFGESRDHLHLVESGPGDDRLHLTVYEMLSDHSGWFVKYQVDLRELPTAYPEMIRGHEHPSSPYYYDFEVFDVIRGEKEQDTFMVVRLHWKIIRYSLMDKSFKQIYTLDNTFCGKIGSFMVHRYTESLTSF